MTKSASPIAALTLILVLPGAVCAQSPATAAKPATAAPAKTLVPVTAEYEVEESRVLADGNVLRHKTTGVYYRDGRGRVRREQGSVAVVNDPVSGTTLVLNTAARIARKTVSAAPRGDGAAPAAAEPDTPPRSRRPEPASAPPKPTGAATEPVTISGAGAGEVLGSRVVEGLTLQGRRYVSLIPAGSRLGNTKPVRVAVEVWASQDAQLPVLTIIQNPVTGNKTQRFKNIRRGVEPDPQLFLVPAGYRMLEASPTPPPPPPLR